MKLNKIAHCIALMGVAGYAFGQAVPDQKLERVEVTGSSIKRVQAAGALPIEVITSEDMDKRGLSSVEDVLRSLSGSASGADSAVSNNNIFGGDTDRLTGGSANANLRGFGPGSTLVLLNGRRLTTYGMSGAGVDVNTIPREAIARIEVLKDGASAIYGTDAVGGVINFITKKDYQGFDIGVTGMRPFSGPQGATRRASVSGGHGSLDKDGFNVMGSFSVDKNDILRAADRSWVNGFAPEQGLSPDSSSSPFANIITGTGTALSPFSVNSTTLAQAGGSRVGNTDTNRYARINLLAIEDRCDAVTEGVRYQPQLWSSATASASSKISTNANNKYLCNTDYGAQYMLAAPKEAANLMMRGAFKLGADHTAFAEFTGSRVEVKSELTPAQFSTGVSSDPLIGTSHYPVNGPHYLNLKNFGVLDFDPTQPIAYRWRMQDFGNRVINSVSTNNRALVGLEGVIGKYDYKLGFSKSNAMAYSDLFDGYAYSTKLLAALKTGIINPWVMPGQSQTPEAMALIESTKARGRVMGGETGLTQLDGSISGELFALPAGPLGFAVGFDSRKETYAFANTTGNAESAITCVSTILSKTATDVLLCPGNTSVPEVSRNVTAFYGELAVPVTKQLELQLALRSDRYDGFGTTTNPKIAFRFQPAQSVVFRGSINTGFKAPSFQQQQVNTAPQDYTGKWSDPSKCGTDSTQCDIIGLDYSSGGNPDLKPEKSKQGSFGVVWAPAKNVAVYADYWRVDLTDRIRNLTITEVLNNYPLFTDRFIRDATTGNVSIVRTGWINAAGSSTKGIDWGISGSTSMAGSKWIASINGTRMLSHMESPLENIPMTEYVGTWGTRTLYLRDKFTAILTMAQGNWSNTVSADFKSGYEDQNLSKSFSNNTLASNTMIDSYTTFGVTSSYSGFKNTSITLGISNLFDIKPPFTHHNVDDAAGAGWDPRVADPYGRRLTINLKHSFK